ncbi:MAG TPA: alpha/beta fold hydrolase [Alphaproteobacteria bacterium]
MKRFILAGFLAGVSPALALAEAPADGPVPRVEWRDCPWTEAPAEARCGNLVALQSRAAPDGPHVRVFFAIYRRTGTEAPLPDPVVIVPGGPGALFNPPVPYVMQGLAALRRQREVIIIDQRGVGRSVPRLVCEAEPTGDGAAPPRRRGALGCLAQLKARGIDPAAFSTEETAEDLRDLRRALKLDAWNPMGASYGSRVVLRLAQIDPEGSRATVIMAVLPLAPSLARAENALARRALLARLFQNCAAEPACAAAYGDLVAKFVEIQALLKEAAQHGAAPEAKGALEHVLAVERRTGGIASALIRRLDWAEELPHLPRAIFDLHAFLTGGKAIPAARIDEIYGLAMPRRLPPIDSTLILVTTRCPEDILPSATPDEGRGHRDACSFFTPAPVADKPPGKTPPLLILTGAYDIRTLTGWADEIQMGVPGSILARFGDAGHDASYRHPCGNALMNAFVADPAAKLDLACVAQHARPKFEVPETVQ